LKDSEILKKLIEFADELSQGWIAIDIVRNALWAIARFLGWIVDTLENVSVQMLGINGLLKDEQFVQFVTDLKPILVVILAFNLLFIGYLLIFQKKFNREGIFMNLIMALGVIVLLGSVVDKSTSFATESVNVIAAHQEEGTLATQVMRDNITDISLYDLDEWKTPKLEDKNKIKPEYTTEININSRLMEGSYVTKDKKLSDKGEKILSKKIETLGDGSRKLVDLDDGGFWTDITKEYYYRYTVDWFNMLATLAIVGFVLVTVSVKLAKLLFELVFNYLIASFVAPADIHSGQKTKMVVQNILSILLVVVCIFLSLKVYLIGVSFLNDHFEGLPYIVAMIGFALAVIDGPNIVERLFGIDAGIKSGWGALAGTYALGKGAAGLGKSAGTMAGKAAMGTAKLGLPAAGAAGAMAGSMGKSGGPKGTGPSGGPMGGKPNGGDSEKGKNPTSEGTSKGQDKAATEAAATKEHPSESQDAAIAMQQDKDSDKNMSLSDEMKQKEGRTERSTPSLHSEMQQKGYSGGSSSSNSVPTRQGVKSMPSPSSGSSNVNGGSGINPASASSGSDTGSSSVPGRPTTGPSSSGASYESASVSSGNDARSSSVPDRQQASPSAPENRHIGHVIRDKAKTRIDNSQTIQRSKTSYQVGKNTGKAMRKPFRKD